jgi:hypothetical protein
MFLVLRDDWVVAFVWLVAFGLTGDAAPSAETPDNGFSWERAIPMYFFPST